MGANLQDELKAALSQQLPQVQADVVQQPGLGGIEGGKGKRVSKDRLERARGGIHLLRIVSEPQIN